MKIKIRSKFFNPPIILSKHANSISPRDKINGGVSTTFIKQFKVGYKNTVALLGDPSKPISLVGLSKVKGKLFSLAISSHAL